MEEEEAEEEYGFGPLFGPPLVFLKEEWGRIGGGWKVGCRKWFSKEFQKNNVCMTYLQHFIEK